MRRQRRIDLGICNLPVPKLYKNDNLNSLAFFHPGLPCSDFGIFGFWDLGIRGFGIQGFGNSGKKHKLCWPVRVVAVWVCRQFSFQAKHVPGLLVLI